MHDDYETTNSKDGPDASDKNVPTPQSSPTLEQTPKPNNKTKTRKKPRLPVRVYRTYRKWLQKAVPPNVAEWITVFLILVTACIAGLQACIYRQQKVIMRGQLSVMQTEQRPWIGAPESVKIDDVEPGKVQITLIFNNAGRTPPSGLYIDANMVPDDDWEREEHRIYKDGMDHVQNNRLRFRQFTIVPSGAFTFSNFPSKDFTSVKISDIQRHKTLVGCVIYETRYDHELHSTGFFVSLQVVNGRVVFDKIIAVDAN